MDNVAPAPNFSLTKSAAERIVLLLQTETGPYFRVQVDGGGCSGGVDADVGVGEGDRVGVAVG